MIDSKLDSFSFCRKCVHSSDRDSGIPTCSRKGSGIVNKCDSYAYDIGKVKDEAADGKFQTFFVLSLLFSVIRMMIKGPNVITLSMLVIGFVGLIYYTLKR